MVLSYPPSTSSGQDLSRLRPRVQDWQEMALDKIPLSRVNAGWEETCPDGHRGRSTPIRGHRGEGRGIEKMLQHKFLNREKELFFRHIMI